MDRIELAERAAIAVLPVMAQLYEDSKVAAEQAWDYAYALAEEQQKRSDAYAAAMAEADRRRRV